MTQARETKMMGNTTNTSKKELEFQGGNQMLNQEVGGV